MSQKSTDKRNELFAKRLEEERKLRNLKQKDLAAAIGVKAATVSQWEAKGAFPSRKNLIRLSEYLGVDKAYLSGEIPVKNPNGDPSTYPTVAAEENDYASYGRLLGRLPNFRTEINNCISILLDKDYTQYLYDFLLIAKDYDSNQWQTMNLWADTLSKCYIPKVKSRHPLTSLTVYRSFFTKTFDALYQITASIDQKAIHKFFKYNEFFSMLESFEYNLMEDYKCFPQTFKSVDDLKKANPKTTTCIEKMSIALKNTKYVDTIKGNELLQDFYSSLLAEAYNSDLKNIVEFVNDTE